VWALIVVVGDKRVSCEAMLLLMHAYIPGMSCVARALMQNAFVGKLCCWDSALSNCGVSIWQSPPGVASGLSGVVLARAVERSTHTPDCGVLKQLQQNSQAVGVVACCIALLTSGSSG